MDIKVTDRQRDQDLEIVVNQCILIKLCHLVKKALREILA